MVGLDRKRPLWRDECVCFCVFLLRLGSHTLARKGGVGFAWGSNKGGVLHPEPGLFCVFRTSRKIRKNEEKSSTFP